MSSSYAANAILAKTRAKYGKHLSEKDYQSLLSCESVSDVVSYLKKNTHYSDILKNVNEIEVHRGQVEMMLRQQLFYEFSSLCRYEISVGEHFAKYITQRNEIAQIMRFLTLLNSDHLKDYILSLPSYFGNQTKIDLQALSRAKNYNDFLDAISSTPYYNLLSNFKPQEGTQPDLTNIENTLYTFMYKNVFKIIGKFTKDREQIELNRLFKTIIDYQNFVRIVRLKEYYNLDPSQIKAQLLPFGSLRKNGLDEMCNAENTKQIFSIMQSTIVGKNLEQMEYNYTDQISLIAKYNISRRKIHFSTYPSVVLLSYIFIMEIELLNVINIVEGVRYKVPKEKIKELIIFY
ncbi:MAG: V-type ATPase subunit [Bacillota bacterium]|nr:V-type ATPase subunit [Bacillota bacterium]